MLRPNLSIIRPLCLSAGLLVLSSVGTAHAAADLCQADSACRKKSDSALKLYNDRKFAESLVEFQAAYDLQHEPRLLLNIGRCLFRLGRPRAALSKYEQFQKEVTDPDKETARAVEKYVVEAKTAVDAEKSDAPPEEPKTIVKVVTVQAPPPEKKPIYKQWWFWTAIGGVAAGGALAVGLGVGLRPKPTPYTDFVWR
jgi:hypothetical protein